MSQALFETIRRAQSCVVDLTHWPSNVLFELGVRLAASGERTRCLIQSSWQDDTQLEWLPQCEALLKLLVPADHHYRPTEQWAKQLAFKKVYGPEVVDGGGVLGGSVHATVETALDVRTEPASRPVYQELLDSAELFSRTPGKGGRSKPVGLYPGHAELPGREEEAEFDRLLAAWYFVNHRYQPAERESNTSLADATAWIAQSISQRHWQRLAGLPSGEVDEIKRVARQAAIAAPQPRNLDEIRSVKLWAVAMRNQREYDVAIKLLEDARVVLDRMSADRGLEPRSLVEIRSELADTFGMKGGVYRRQQRLHEAYEEYKQGEAVEHIDQQSTYNLSNVISLGVSHEGISPMADDMRRRIQLAIRQLEGNTGGERTDEWWAWSDLGQLYLLSGDANKAEHAYERARKTGPTSEEYRRHVDMLKQLYEVTSKTAPEIAQGIDRLLTELSTTTASPRTDGV